MLSCFYFVLACSSVLCWTHQTLKVIGKIVCFSLSSSRFQWYNYSCTLRWDRYRVGLACTWMPKNAKAKWTTTLSGRDSHRDE